MRRLPFWMLMCLLSMMNGLLFFQMTFALLRRGIPDVDNQGALLMIPLFWIAAAIVFVVLNIVTFVDGRHIPRNAKADPLAAFRFQGLNRREMVGRVVFLAIAAFLVYFAFHFSHHERILSAAYAITGGMLLILLYGWRCAAVKERYDRGEKGTTERSAP